MTIAMEKAPRRPQSTYRYVDGAEPINQLAPMSSAEKSQALHAQALRLPLSAHSGLKYRPDQPRIPAGQPGGGQWAGAGDNTVDVVQHGGMQVAQVGTTIDPSALTGISTIDDATRDLVSRLKYVVDSVHFISARVYGVAVHFEFGAVVHSMTAPAGGSYAIEKSFVAGDVVRYGLNGSIRTDVILKNVAGDIVAIYDVKTGDATLRPSRVHELRTATGVGPSISVIELNVRRGIILKSAIAVIPGGRLCRLK